MYVHSEVSPTKLMLKKGHPAYVYISTSDRVKLELSLSNVLVNLMERGTFLHRNIKQILKNDPPSHLQSENMSLTCSPVQNSLTHSAQYRVQAVTSK